MSEMLLQTHKHCGLRSNLEQFYLGLHCFADFFTIRALYTLGRFSDILYEEDHFSDSF